MKKRFQNFFQHYFDSLYESMCEDRYSIQLQLVETNSNSLMLDCGCREGDNTLRMARQIGTHHIIGLDYIYSALYRAGKTGIFCIQSNLNDSIPLQNDSVDIILATDVIEHLIKPAVFVKEMFRVLKPSGYMILDTPNLSSWHNIFALLIGIQPFSGPNITTMEDSDIDIVRKMHRVTHGLNEEGEFQEHSELELTRHIVVIAYNSLINLLKRAGFVIEKEYGFGYYPLPPFIAHFLQRFDIRHTHHLVIKTRKVL
ncbi:MAG: class I SAM-dependent methyltransferase [Anaerolineales bacterium]